MWARIRGTGVFNAEKYAANIGTSRKLVVGVNLNTGCGACLQKPDLNVICHFNIPHFHIPIAIEL